MLKSIWGIFFVSLPVLAIADNTVIDLTKGGWSHSPKNQKQALVSTHGKVTTESNTQSLISPISQPLQQNSLKTLAVKVRPPLAVMKKPGQKASESKITAAPETNERTQLVKPRASSPRYAFFDVAERLFASSVMPHDRLWVENGIIQYRLLPGTLKENIEALRGFTENTQHVVWDVSPSHRVYAETVLSGESMYHLVNKILTSYSQPSQILMGLYDGNTIRFFYGDQE